MARRTAKKARQARGFLFDENVPAELSRYFGSRGFRVAHIGISGPGYTPAPIKGTTDAGLRFAVQDWIFWWKDDSYFRNRRFVQGKDHWEERAADNTVINRGSLR